MVTGRLTVVVMKGPPEVSTDGIEVIELMVEEIEIKSPNDYPASDRPDVFQHRNLPINHKMAYPLVRLFDF